MPTSADYDPIPDLERLHQRSMTPPPFEQLRPALSQLATKAQRTRSRLLVPVVAAGGVAVVVLALLVIPGPWGNGTTHVNAEEIVQRASQNATAASASLSYHIVATTQGPQNTGSGQTTETWSLDATHVRVDEGDSGVSADGQELWLWATVNGSPRVVHTANVLGTPNTGTTPVAESLAILLSRYGKGCSNAASLTGHDTVLGRDTYVVTLQTDHPCGQATTVHGPSTLTLWVDTQTFVALRTVESDGAGVSAYTYQATEFEVGLTIPESKFRYQAPAGVEVTEVPAAQAKQAIKSFADATSKATASP